MTRDIYIEIWGSNYIAKWTSSSIHLNDLGMAIDGWDNLWAFTMNCTFVYSYDKSQLSRPLSRLRKRTDMCSGSPYNLLPINVWWVFFLSLFYVNSQATCTPSGAKLWTSMVINGYRVLSLALSPLLFHPPEKGLGVCTFVHKRSNFLFPYYTKYHVDSHLLLVVFSYDFQPSIEIHFGWNCHLLLNWTVFLLSWPTCIKFKGCRSTVIKFW